MWPLFVSLLLNSFVIQAFPVFTFNGTPDSLATPSFAYLVSDVELPDTFIICSSIKQARFDDVSFYSISGKDSLEWMRVEFRTYSKATKLALRWDGKFHRVGKLQNPRLDYWYHICLSLDSTKGKMEIAVNGDSLGNILDKNVTNIPSKLKMQIGNSYDNQQFQGSVANIRIFKEGNTTDVSAVPCKLRQSTILPWNPNNWKVVGSEWSLVEEFEDIFCAPSDHYNLAIPLRITINESMDICKYKLNNSIIPFQEDHDLFHMYITWHENTTGGICSNIWTPFSDQQTEGLFLNMNNNAVAELQVWDKAQPNGERDENFVVINIPRAALIDVARNTLSCSSCLLSSSLLLQLDGLCEGSRIGNRQFVESLKAVFNSRKEVQDPEHPVFSRLQWMGKHVHQVTHMVVNPLLGVEMQNSWKSKCKTLF